MRLEDQLQIDIVQFLRLALPKLLFFHVANQRKTSPRRGALLKKMGVMAGVPDLVFILPQGRVGFIELKVKGKESKVQGEFFTKARGNGAHCEVAHNVDEVIELLKEWDVKL